MKKITYLFYMMLLMPVLPLQAANLFDCLVALDHSERFPIHFPTMLAKPFPDTFTFEGKEIDRDEASIKLEKAGYQRTEKWLQLSLPADSKTKPVTPEIQSLAKSYNAYVQELDKISRKNYTVEKAANTFAPGRLPFVTLYRVGKEVVRGHEMDLAALVALQQTEKGPVVRILSNNLTATQPLSSSTSRFYLLINDELRLVADVKGTKLAPYAYDGPGIIGGAGMDINEITELEENFAGYAEKHGGPFFAIAADQSISPDANKFFVEKLQQILQEFPKSYAVQVRAIRGLTPEQVYNIARAFGPEMGDKKAFAGAFLSKYKEGLTACRGISNQLNSSLTDTQSNLERVLSTSGL